MKFFVAKVDVTKVKRRPLTAPAPALALARDSYESLELRLPVRLGLLNAEKKQDLIVYLLHPSSRFESSNYTNVFAPTNLEVVDAVRKSFASFYAELFDATLAPMQGKAVVTEYAWQTDSCDPCPTPPLQPQDIVVLGGKADGATGNHGGWGGDGFSSWCSRVCTLLALRSAARSPTICCLQVRRRPRTAVARNGNGTSDEFGRESLQLAAINMLPGALHHQALLGRQSRVPERRSFNRWGGPPGFVGADRKLPSHPPHRRRAWRSSSAARFLSDSVRTPVPSLGLPGQPPADVTRSDHGDRHNAQWHRWSRCAARSSARAAE